VVEVQENKDLSTIEGIQKHGYDFKPLLKILCFIKERECKSLETYGKIIKISLGMNEEVYRYISSLETDGMIVKYRKNKKKIIELTKQGDEAIKECFFKLCPNYETEGLLKRFIEYLSSETTPFLKRRRNSNKFAPDKYLYLLNEELLELYKTTFSKFCRDGKVSKREVS